MMNPILPLLQNCASLGDNDKQHLVRLLPSLDAQESARLEHVLRQTEIKREALENTKKTEKQKLNAEYEAAVQDFHTHSVKQIRTTAEANVVQSDIQNAEKQLDAFLQ